MAKNEFHEKCKFLVSTLLRGKIAWGKEIKIAKKLLVDYPDIDFWKNLYMDTYPSSLSLFLTKTGKTFLKKEYDCFLFTSGEKIKIEKEPLIEVETRKGKKEPKTLKDFIDN